MRFWLPGVLIKQEFVPSNIVLNKDTKNCYYFLFLFMIFFQGTTAASHGKIEFGRAQIDFALLPAADILQNILLNLVVYLFLVFRLSYLQFRETSVIET